MSCRSTHAGTLATRLARSYSGLPDRIVTSLFHALKREAGDSAPPTQQELDSLRVHLRELLEDAGLSDSQAARSERDLLLARDEEFTAATFHALNNIEARARQESVLRSVKGLVADLDPPGAQADYYEYGPDGRPRQVWYASYGSNLNMDRFLTYVQGGTPEGTTAEHEGCRDKTPPPEDMPIRFAGRMHFAAGSGRWDGGGVAFMDNDTVGHALGRAFLLTSEQFDDVVAQENGRQPGSLTVDMADAVKNGRTGVTYGLYGDLVHIGDYSCAPVFTFTSSFSASESLHQSRREKKNMHATNTPSANYIRMIGSGLAETFEMSTEDQADYLRGSLGLSSTPRAEVIRILQTAPDPPKQREPRQRFDNTRSSSTRGMARDMSWDAHWPPARDYRPWFMDEDPQPSLPGESDPYERDWTPAWDERYEPTLFDDLPMALADDEEPDMFTWGHKRCVICDSAKHTMHDCPALISER
jgi:hypothetical protein